MNLLVKKPAVKGKQYPDWLAAILGSTHMCTYTHTNDCSPYVGKYQKYAILHYWLHVPVFYIYTATWCECVT